MALTTNNKKMLAFEAELKSCRVKGQQHGETSVNKEDGLDGNKCSKTMDTFVTMDRTWTSKP